jgi:hypothetical protein
MPLIGMTGNSFMTRLGYEAADCRLLSSGFRRYPAGEGREKTWAAPRSRVRPYFWPANALVHIVSHVLGACVENSAAGPHRPPPAQAGVRSPWD